MSKIRKMSKPDKFGNVSETSAKNWANLKDRLIEVHDATDLVKTNEFSHCIDNGSSLTFIVDEMEEIHITHSYCSVIALRIGGESNYVTNEWFGNHSVNVNTNNMYDRERNDFIRIVKQMFERYYTYQIRWENTVTNESGSTHSVYTKESCLWEIERFGEYRDKDLPPSNDSIKYTLRRAYHNDLGKLQWYREKTLRPFKNSDLPVSLTA